MKNGAINWASIHIVFLVNLVAGVIFVYKENKTDNKSFFKAFIFFTIDFIMDTSGFYVAIVLGSLLFGITLVFYS
ncbi:hypothetical protein ACQKM9_09080 [Viridibacillus sp. NPDC093762]|uniref:hypothetical protein n=1 Tax=Viridibacillus sp. NPDC093762 TaxID=3390720 RepID=UPI003D01C565